MKKLKVILKVLLFAALVAPWSSCSKSDDNVPDDGKDTDKERICKQIAEVHEEVMPYYKRCMSISELQQYEEQIRAMENVNDVYFTNICMFVDVKDFGPISFAYYPKVESSIENELIQEMTKKIKTRAEGTHNMLNLGTVVIANQQANDEAMSSRGACAEFTKEMLEDCGFTVAPINNAPSVDFFTREMFEYDMVFILTHGVYDYRGSKLHWLLTGEVKDDDNSYQWYEKIWEWVWKSWRWPSEEEYKDRLPQMVSFHTYNVTQNGKEVPVTCAIISETLIDESQYSFKNKGKAIVFNMACQSVMGPNPETEDSIDYSMAQIFVDKGAGAYLGYDESNSTGQTVGVYYFCGLASGMSTLNSYKNLTFWNRHNFCQSNKGGDLVRVDSEEVNFDVLDRNIVEEHWADLLIYPDNGMKIKNSYITMPKPQLEIAYPLVANDALELKANCINYCKYWVWNTFSYGFDISESETFEEVTRLCEKHLGDEGCSYFKSERKVNYTYIFNVSDKLKPMKRYYCRAFFFNGFDYYYSDAKSFINRSLHNGSEIPDIPGTDF